MKKFRKFMVLAVLAGGIFVAFPAEAARESKLDKMFGDSGQKKETVASITAEDRAIIETYISEKLMPKCPAGLDKKEKDCLPPGQKKKKYIVGEKIRGGIYLPVQADLLKQIAPLPKGYKYVRVDRDILLLDDREKIIIDAISKMPEITEAEKTSKKRTHVSRTRISPSNDSPTN